MPAEGSTGSLSALRTSFCCSTLHGRATQRAGIHARVPVSRKMRNEKAGCDNRISSGASLVTHPTHPEEGQHVP